MTAVKNFTEKKLTMKDLRNNPLYMDTFQTYGNDKMKDYHNEETGEFFKYAQFSTIAGICCPYASIGCAIACYAKTGCHVFKSTKELRKRQYEDTLRNDFVERMIYTIETELTSKRYFGNHMMLRLHESGDFYSMEYLRKWLEVFDHFKTANNFTTCFYTKSFVFFDNLSPEEKQLINECLEKNVLAISWSLDDTTTLEQIALAMKLKEQFPLSNIYYCAENIDEIAHDNECKCEDCAKCGTCTKTNGTVTVVKIHSVTEQKKAKYHNNRRDSKK